MFIELMQLNTSPGRNLFYNHSLCKQIMMIYMAIDNLSLLFLFRFAISLFVKDELLHLSCLDVFLGPIGDYLSMVKI